MFKQFVKIQLIGFMCLLASCKEPKASVPIASNVIETANWKTLVEKRLPEYGHRNWIVIADAAYPKQSASGIETIYTGAKQIDVLKHVLSLVESANHIRPIVMFDSELESVTEKNASGVQSYRTELKKLLGDAPFKIMSHEDIISKLDKGSELFNVLLLKTDMTIPYTSVFIELECGYWSAEKEEELRKSIKQTQGK